MESLTLHQRLTRRAYWLIRLRWIAILWTCVATFLTHRLWGIPQQHLALYGVAAVLVLENVLSLWFLGRICKPEGPAHSVWIRRIIHFQICADLVLLTVLLHLSGGIENPFMVWFIFHVAIASTLLSARESYMVAAFAVFLLLGVGVLEYLGFLPHYCLTGILTTGFHTDGIYVLGSLGVMAVTLFLVVYMTSNIASKLRQQEEAYRCANVQLQQKDRIKNEYVARVTHDIKGHLAAIQSCHDVVVRGLVGPLTEPQQDFIGRAYTRTVALNGFVRALLNLTEMRLTDKFDISAFVLREVMDRAVARVKNQACEKEVTLTHHGMSETLEVMGYQTFVEEAIWHLLLNAIQYTPAGGQVDLSARVQADHVCVTVRDTGIGIPEQEMSKVCDEFYRASNAGTMEKSGTGLGLALVRQIIERHRGTVAIESRLGVGTSVRLTLPLAEPGDEAEDAGAPVIKQDK
jgi:signal transduction histidine kinase